MPEREQARDGYITIKAIHVWGPFIFQLVVLIGGYFQMQQKVDDLIHRVDSLEAQLFELRARLYK